MNKFVLINCTSGSKTVLSSVLETEHSWVTVVNPTNHRLLLQACDDCGVVKSENSVLRVCRATKGQSIVSGRMADAQQLVS